MREHRPSLLFIAGPNGAGKSTLAPALLRDEIGLLEFVNADTIALGLSAFAPETAAIEAGRVMLGRVRSLAARRESFALETTLATRSYAPWVGGLRERSGYSFHVLYVWLRSADLAVARVAERVRVGGHGVPEATIRRRYALGAHNFFELYRPLADSWAVYDNSVAGALRRAVRNALLEHARLGNRVATWRGGVVEIEATEVQDSAGEAPDEP